MRGRRSVERMRSPTESSPTTYEVVSNERQRSVLVALFEQSPRSDAPTALEEAAGTGPLSVADRIEYRHVHFPKLDDYGFIDWDRERERIERGPRFGEIEPLLERWYAVRDGERVD